MEELIAVDPESGGDSSASLRSVISTMVQTNWFSGSIPADRITQRDAPDFARELGFNIFCISLRSKLCKKLFLVGWIYPKFCE